MAVAPGIPIDRVRVKNGYGLCTSALSASVIGHFDASSEQRKATNRAWDDRYHEDARFQMKQLEKNHPVRKILHMQKCYPETVRRLNDPTTNELKKTSSLNQTDAGFAQSRSSSSSRWHRGISPNTRKAPGKASTQASSQRASERESGQASKPATLKHAPHQPSSETAAATHNINSSKARRGGTESVASDETQRRRQRVAHEYEFCHAKMAYNRTKGREAEVDGILTGRSPVDKTMPLFPARATHQQLLGLTYRPINPNNPAPEVPRERKWLGDNVGWEGNRGIPTPPAGRDAKDGEIRPWPSTKYPSLAADQASGPTSS